MTSQRALAGTRVVWQYLPSGLCTAAELDETFIAISPSNRSLNLAVVLIEFKVRGFEPDGRGFASLWVRHFRKRRTATPNERVPVGVVQVTIELLLL